MTKRIMVVLQGVEATVPAQLLSMAMLSPLLGRSILMETMGTMEIKEGQMVELELVAQFLLSVNQ